MISERVRKLADILVTYSADIQPGDRVLLEGTTAAEPLIHALYEVVMARGGHPQPFFSLDNQEQLFYKYATDVQLKHTPELRKYAYEEFESRIRIHSLTDTRALSQVDPQKQSAHTEALKPIMEAQLRRGAAKQNKFKWVTTLFPTESYAAEAGMSMDTYEDFVYSACHANEADPVKYWQNVKKEQQRIIDRIAGCDEVKLRGPNVDLKLSIKERTFINACGEHNMPDGEIYTGPVEESVSGWVRFSYPAITNGRVVEGVELTFVDGAVSQAKAKTNQDFLLKMLDVDEGTRYVGEFAIGTNFEINRFTGNILFDEKIGGSFHMALGAGYPETGSKNKSAIHWDMICDMRQDAEISVDGEVIYRNGEFVL